MSLSTPPISSDNKSGKPTTDKPETPVASPSVVKLRKIPPIPVRQRAEAAAEDDDDGSDEGEGDSTIVDASVLGLNHIRTRSAPLPLKTSNSLGTPTTRFREAMDSSSRISPASLQPTPQMHVESDRVGKKVQWSQQSKSWRFPSQYSSEAEGSHAALAKEMQSPRFQAILRATSGKRRACDIKSFSHELNSKGVRPMPFWKSRAFGRSEVFTAMVRAKFDKLKEEVNSDLGIFAGDLVGILEGPPESHNGCKESLEDLLIVARKCAKMPPNEFWGKCEGIVQNLDDRRQELSMRMLKQVLTRLLFILTRCTRLVQFQKESSHEDEHLLASQQLSDLGVYSEGQYGLNDDLSDGRRLSHKVSEHHHGVLIAKQDLVDENNDVEVDSVEVNTAKSVASSTGSFRMSSWKKLPSAAEKNRKTHDRVDSPSNNKSDHSQFKGDIDALDNLDTPVFQPEHSDESLKVRKVTWGAWDQQNVNYEDSFICRICEVEIPTVHVEPHSGICTIADRCDLKGLTVNERLERVVETLERILESWTPKSSDTGIESPDILRASPPGMIYDLDEPPNTITLSRSFGEDMLDFSVDTNKDCILEGCNVPEVAVIPDKGKMALSCGSLTPRSPLVTPRTRQVELLLNGRKTISEFESYQQISKLLDIARSVSNMNSSDYNTLEYMLERLEDLKYVIQDRKVDALVVETFGRRIEKLLQEKYVSLCGQIEDVKSESSNLMADDDSSMEDDTIRSLRASPINPCSKDRTSIEDFEIIKPISRGAFGRVFLARKRATGDLFAIKVLKKVDMIRKNAVESILSERDILISVRNPFVVRFFYSFTCRENLYLVMEYLNGGDLFSLLKVLGCLEEEMARTYIAELVLALEYLHSLNVIHRDLKPDNLLIGPDGHIKLTDFGLSKVGLINSTDDLSGPAVRDAAFFANNNTKLTEKSSTKRQERQKHSVVGTPDYLAPEILLGMGHGATADWWSVGVILFELLVGLPPFNADHPQQIFNNIMNRDIPWPKVPEEMSREAYDLIDKLLIENPVQRLGATGAAEVKRHPFFKDINWDTLARNKAAFIPAAEPHDTSYFMSRYIWNPEDENIKGFGDFDEMSETGSASCSSSYSNLQDEDDDECGNLADFSGPSLEVKYSFSNFSFKNLSQLASINYDLLVKNAKESLEAESRSVS